MHCNKAGLCAGRVHVHALAAAAASTAAASSSATRGSTAVAGSAPASDPTTNPNPTLTLPPPGAPADVACLALSQHFLVAGTASGGLWLFRCAERVPVAETRHAGGGVRRVWPQPAGVRCVLHEDLGPDHGPAQCTCICLTF